MRVGGVTTCAVPSTARAGLEGPTGRTARRSKPLRSQGVTTRRTLPNWIGIFALALPLGLFAGCGGGMDGTPTPPPVTPAPPPPPVPTTVTVTPEKVELMSPGATAQLAAEVRDQRGQVMTGVSVTWASSDDRTARVDTAGLVTAVAGGKATVTATVGEASGITEVMVIDMEWATDFAARTHVVDGLLNTAVRVDPTCTADCDHATYPGTGQGNFGTVKAVTGIDAGMTGPGDERWMARRRDEIASGRIANGRIVRTYADIEIAREDGDLALMFYLQRREAPNWQLRGDVAALRRWYDEGLRVFQVARGSSEATGPGERLGYGGNEGDGGGVTDLGRFAIAEMNALGMIVDVSHSNRQTTLDTAALSTRPIIANHANAEALTSVSRNKTDEELVAIAATGGVIGVTTIRWMLDTDDDRRAGMDDLIAHVEYMVDLVGIDHVGISTDAWMDGWEQTSGHYADADLAAPDRWVRLTARLRARGWTEEDLAKLLGGNFLRVFREVLPPR